MTYGTLAFALIFSIFAWHFMPWPLVWILLAGAGASAVVTATLVRPVLKTAALVMFMFSVVFLIGESVFWILPEPAVAPTTDDSRTQEGSYTQGYFERNVAPLGYRPYPDMQVDSRLLHEGRVIYDVVYTIDSNRLRITPSAVDGATTSALLFFGGSFTFGEGLNDAESMPYQLAEMTERRYHVLNFGFHGYSAHQMLAALESGIVDEILGDRVPEFILYQASSDHARRTAGKASWDTSGPRYRLKTDGDVVLEGPFDQTQPEPSMLDRSSIGRRVLATLRGRTNGRDWKRLSAIVTRSHRIAQQKWPGVDFRVLVWDTRGKKLERLVRTVERAGIRITKVSDIIPDYLDERENYRIPHDRHPNAKAQRQIARYVAGLVGSRDR